MLIQENLSIEEKLRILSDAAKYDVSCSSSGSKRGGQAGKLGSALPAGCVFIPGRRMDEWQSSLLKSPNEQCLLL